MRPLTPTQRLVYDFLLAFLLEHQRQPTIRDIGRHFGWTSPNGVLCHIRALVKKGWLERDQWRHHRWRFVGIQLRAEPVAEPQGVNNGLESSTA